VKLVIRDPKNRVGAPHVRIDRAAARPAAAAPSSVNTTFFPSFENEAERQ
jgi:hypothetical protein